MSLRELETHILAELREVAGKRSLRLKDIMEWKTAELKPQDGETLYYLPKLKIWCCVQVQPKEKK